MVKTLLFVILNMGYLIHGRRVTAMMDLLTNKPYPASMPRIKAA